MATNTSNEGCHGQTRLTVRTCARHPQNKFEGGTRISSGRPSYETTSPHLPLPYCFPMSYQSVPIPRFLLTRNHRSPFVITGVDEFLL